MTINISKGASLPIKEGIEKTILVFLKSLLEDKIFDGILIPMRVPAGDSYAWILVKDSLILDKANPLAPVMPVQGAKALKSLTRKGKGNLKFAAVMRPCEIRASVELAKLNQVHLENITLMSVDCPGALPLSDYTQNPQKGEERFKTLLSGENWGDDSTKPVCQVCDHFSLLPSADFHFGLLTGQAKTLLLIAGSQKGEQILSTHKLSASVSLADWKKRVDERTKNKKKQRADRFREVQKQVEGFDGLLQVFSSCIGCHNCQSACPICYCRQCYFDSEVSKLDLDFILQKAERRGSLSFPLDKRMFHVGRMSHMSLSCVSCGLCSDACPVSIPVAEVFSYVADQTQHTFEYKAGEDRDADLPIQQYRLDEIKGIEKWVRKAEEVES